MASRPALYSVSSNPLSPAASQLSTQPSSARIVARRKAKLNVYFREECEDRSVSGEAQKTLTAHFTSFIEDYIAKTTPEYEIAGAGVEFRLQEAFDADHKAWEVFRAQNFPCEPISLTKITFDSIIKPTSKNLKPTAALHPPLNRIGQDNHHTHTSHPSPASNSQLVSQQMMTMLDGNLKRRSPTCKPGWNKESKSSLLKGVLVSNANKILITYELHSTQSSSSIINSLSGSLLEKETIHGHFINSTRT
ncbi:hypothetical protein C8J55DRAFT_523422 [Lentinula edodes]|uniref:Uncharacterized protein n=1 Tax=Lentinula lateritia TaxID=40482 RepID=A0A9W9DGJ9_9AGAR|nr:hypothetical protein C8J55DRAFT_523422 [Lentinula edodes]